MGGPEVFATRLAHANATDLIDFFNEPGFLAPTLFHYAGRPDLSSHWMQQFSKRYTLHGVPGDDDSGAMSAYYVWLSMGLFPNAGQDLYFLNAPLVPYLAIDWPELGMLTIIRKGKGNYIASVRVNGHILNRAWVRQRDLSGNTTITFLMSQSPTTWGQTDPPPSDTAAAGQDGDPAQK